MVAVQPDREVTIRLMWNAGAKRWELTARMTEQGTRDLVKVFVLKSRHEIGRGDLAALVGALEREMDSWLW